MKQTMHSQTKQAKGLKYRLWVYFVLFAAAIMAILWLLQIIFLNTYYESMKTSEVQKLGRQLIEQYDNENYDDILFRSAFNNGFMIQIFDREGNVLHSSAPFMKDEPGGGMMGGRFGSIKFSDFMSRIQSSDASTICYTIHDGKSRDKSLVFGAKWPDAKGKEVYMLLYAPLMPVDTTVSVLQNQLFVVSVLSLVLALVLSFLIASKLAKPIRALTDSAGELAKGNYDVTFRGGGGYREIDQLAESLNYATEELSKTDQLRKDLIANVSHDLRTPLTMVKAYAEMIQDISGDNPEKRNAHAGVIIQEADRLSELVGDMLDLSRMQAGLMLPEPEELDLGLLTRQTAMRFQGMCEKQGYQILLQATDDCFVWADGKRMGQVIYNLIGNAVNYTGEDKTVRVKLVNSQGKVYFAVSDTGKGIPEGQRNEIWERYCRSSETHRRPVSGTGLGLSIVKEILEASGADYGVESELGKGSTFWFSLPQHDEDQTEPKSY